LFCTGLDGAEGRPGLPGLPGSKGDRGQPGIAEGGRAGEFCNKAVCVRVDLAVPLSHISVFCAL